MNVFELTRALVDIESITENEGPVAAYLLDYVSKLAARTGGRAERMDVEGARFNVLASWGEPRVTMSTHMDTVPPFFPSREDGEFIWGRGACDAKGLIAAMVAAAEQLRGEGVSDFAMLFVVGEERNSAGAYAAVKAARGLRYPFKYLINGEPTESKMAIASKGILRYELVARGKMAHSAYPELGDSAIERLLDALEAIRKIELPCDPQLGETTVNIGTISGGRAPNVIPDAAKAEIMIRLVGDVQPVRDLFTGAVGERAELVEILTIPPIRFATVDGLPTSVVSFATDVPVFGTAWGQPLLFGPGSIHVAHTTEERISKSELAAAVGTYADMVKKLLAKN
jgi:acetylornithine deacetylase